MRIASLCVLGSLVFSCSDKPDEASVYETRESLGVQDVALAPASIPPPPASPSAPAAMKSQATAPGGSNSADSVAPSMMIRTGHARIEVDSLEPAVAAVRSLAGRLGGYVANTSMQIGREQLREASIELRIPALRFDSAIAGLSPLGEVEAVNVNAQDVGEEFVNVQARMANGRRLEARLIDLLATRTGKLEDVLAVERELARIREEIDRYEGRIRYLRSQVSMSTLTVTVHEPPPLGSAYRGENVIANAFRLAWRNFVGFVAGFIAALGVIVPLAVLAILAWLVVRRYRGRKGASERG